MSESLYLLIGLCILIFLLIIGGFIALFVFAIKAMKKQAERNDLFYENQRLQNEKLKRELSENQKSE